MSDTSGEPLDPEREGALRAFLASHDIVFNDLTLLDLALTHSSYAFENNLPENNERLEFLGDAVIGLLVTLHLYSEEESSSEGELSKQKAQLVSRNVLGRLAFGIGIGQLMKFGRGEEQTGGRKRFSVLGSALEALVGAIYLDQGLAAARHFVAPVLLNVHDTITRSEDFQDYKSQLQELVQKMFGVVPRYETTGSEGPDHDKVFYVVVTLDGRVIGQGKGRRVKSAENRAAKAAIGTLQGE